jgi:small GTP-binding protein
MSYNYLFKLIVVGKESVGKTCLVDAWCGRSFRIAFESTVGVDFDAKRVLIDGAVIKNHIWDITGQQKFATIVSAYYGKCAGAFVVFDVTNKQSFFNIDYWIQEIKAKNDRMVPIIIVGTKTDKPNRIVSTEEATLFAEDRGLQYIETSAKKGENIEESFQLLINEIYNNIDEDSEIETFKHGIKRGALRKSNKLRYRNCEPCGDEWRCCLIS